MAKASVCQVHQQQWQQENTGCALWYQFDSTANIELSVLKTCNEITWNWDVRSPFCKLQKVRKKLGWDITSLLFGPQQAWKNNKRKSRFNWFDSIFITVSVCSWGFVCLIIKGQTSFSAVSALGTLLSSVILSSTLHHGSKTLSGLLPQYRQYKKRVYFNVFCNLIIIHSAEPNSAGKIGPYC